MKEIKENLFELASFCFMVRSFISGPTISDALILITLIISIVYTKNYLNQNKLDLSNSVQDDIKLLKNEISMLKLERGFKKVVTNGPTTQSDLRF